MAQPLSVSVGPPEVWLSRLLPHPFLCPRPDTAPTAFPELGERRGLLPWRPRIHESAHARPAEINTLIAVELASKY